MVSKFRPEGSSGTEIYSGVISEDYLHELGDPQLAAVKYDKMRRGDSRVKMLIKVVTAPILGAKWLIQPSDNTPEAKRIADFISFALFDDMGDDMGYSKSWTEFVQEWLTLITYGYSAFEVVYKISYNDNYGQYIGLKNLGWRSPKTIYNFNVNDWGKLESISQQVSGDIAVQTDISAKDLLLFTNEKEGSNYAGISELRSIYGNWKRKQNNLKLLSAGLQRSALGFPIVKKQTGRENDPLTASLKTDLAAITSYYRNYLILPQGTDITFEKIPFDAKGCIDSINQENVNMTQSFLANFMELGMLGAGGSFSLGKELTNLFFKSILIYPTQFSETINKDLIKKLVDVNFGKQKEYPVLTFTGLGDEVTKQRADIIKVLVDGGLVNVDDRLKAQLASEFDLPEFVENNAQSLSVTSELTLPNYFELSENAKSTIVKAVDGTSEIVESNLTEMSKVYIDEIMVQVAKATNNASAYNEAKKVKIKGTQKYKQELTEVSNEILSKSTENVLDELELKESDIKLSKPTATNGAIETTKLNVTSIVDAQVADLEKVVILQLSNSLDNAKADATIKASLDDAANAFIDSTTEITSTNLTAKTVNTARNSVFQTKEALEVIESFVYTNASPKSAICTNLAGRVFSKAEYLATPYLPPNHHRCKSYIVAQLISKKVTKPVTIGLTPTGTEEEIAKIQKSKTF